MGGPGSVMGRLADALSAHGLILRGGFHPDPSEAAQIPRAPGEWAAGTILLVGSAGVGSWPAFAAWREAHPARAGLSDPLDDWTLAVIEPIARAIDATPVYPFAPPYQPFQRWAARADAVHASPLGILIHPEYGLWHAYRAALVFAEKLDLPPRPDAARPCESCDDKPCLSACPVDAFTDAGYDVAACAGHLATPASVDCHTIGCRARDACPVGTAYRYTDAQRRFHMGAFARARMSVD